METQEQSGFKNTESEEQPEFTNMEKCANMIHIVSALLQKEGYKQDSEALVALYKIIEYRNGQEGKELTPDWDKKMLAQYINDTDTVFEYLEDETKDNERFGGETIPDDEIITTSDALIIRSSVKLNDY